MYTSIISYLDNEIQRLREVRAILGGIGTLPDITVPKRGRGRPKGSVKKAAPVVKKAARTMSPEGRARVAAAQKNRWALAKKTGKKAAASV